MRQTKELSDSLLISLIIICVIALTFILTKKYFSETVIIPVQKIQGFDELRIQKPHSLGKKNGVKFIYFYNYDCSYCKDIHSDISKIFEKFRDDVSFYFLNVFETENQVLYKSAIASQCVINFEGDRFLDFGAQIFKNVPGIEETDKFSIENYITLPPDDYKVIERCISHEQTRSEVENIQKIVDFYNIDATPSFIIEDHLINGKLDYSVLNAMLEELAK